MKCTAGYVANQPPYAGQGTYYSALMTNRVLQGGRSVGIPAEAWKSARPSTSAASTASGPTLGGIDVALACQQQYAPGYQAQYRDYNDPYSWYCQPPAGSGAAAGGVDLDRACTTQYAVPARSALNARNAYGWYCLRQ